MKPRRVTYKNWAGISITGANEWLPPKDSKSHLNRAAWLTAAVETGAKFGTVQSYDGAGMSAGIEHKIAVLPKTMEQGSLWDLVLKMSREAPNATFVLLSRFRTELGWYIDDRGQLRNTKGALVSAEAIRNEFAPPNGQVPESGPDFNKAVQWAEVWSETFADPATHKTQIAEARRSLLLSHKVVESQVYRKFAGLEDASAATTENLSPELDLAMCFYHSFSVNAPSKARKILETVLSNSPQQLDFCKNLIKSLGSSDYANWKQRYVRTRTKALNSGLWDVGLFQSVAPEKL